MTAAQTAAAFAAVDWGTSSFRLWLIAADGTVLAERRSGEGMTTATETGFAPILAGHLAAAGAGEDLPVLVCGMAGARQGWVEAPYLDVPGPLAGLAAHTVRVPDQVSGGRDVRILPGLAQRRPHPDVMRGEETQLAGLAAAGVSGLVAMPGTHCKWVTLADGRVEGFRSTMTGEVFALLSRQSILRHATAGARPAAPEAPAFLAAVDRGLADPAGLSLDLFEIRAGQLLGVAPADEGVERLSGLLIGAEVGAALRDAPAGAVTLVSQGGLGPLYAAALRRAGRRVDTHDAEEITRAGLVAAARDIWEFA